MSRDEFADFVFVGIATYKRWLRGEIQSKPLDKLVRLRTDLRCLEATASELVNKLSATRGTSWEMTISRPLSSLPRMDVTYGKGGATGKQADQAA